MFSWCWVFSFMVERYRGFLARLSGIHRCEAQVLVSLQVLLWAFFSVLFVVVSDHAV